MSYQTPPSGPHDTRILEQWSEEPPRAARSRQLLAALAVVVAIAIAAGALGLAYVQLRLSDVERVDATSLRSSTRGMTVLLVGSDSRAGLEPGQDSFGTADQVSGQRSDAIMLLRIRPGGGAAVLSIPRDLWVPIAGTAKSGRINGAYAGGPDRLIETITQALGIPIDHYVEVNFDGFREVVDAVGGLNMYFAAPARDGLAELDVPVAGCVLLTGSQGLAYVRSRHFETFQDGGWRTDPTGDFGRIERQQDFIRRMISKAVSRGVKNPLVANQLLNALVQSVRFDSGLGAVDLAKLGWQMRTLRSGSLEMMTLPTEGTRIAGAAVLELDEPEATEAISRFVNPPPDAGDAEPSETAVRVLNGSGRPGEAGAAAQALRAEGFTVVDTGDARAQIGTTTITYAQGAVAKAELVASLVGGAFELRADGALSGADVVLTTGSTFAGVAGTAPADVPPPAAPAGEPAAQPAPECLP